MMKSNWKRAAGAALTAALACGLLAAVPAAAQAKVVGGGNYACSESATGSHSWTEKVTKRATCGKAGYKGVKCASCGDVVRTKTLKKTGKHKWKSVTVKAKKCKAGYKGKKCKVCGEVKKTKVLKAKGKHQWKTESNQWYHTHEGWFEHRGTCVDPTVETTACKVCGKVKKTKVLKAEHQWSTVSTTGDCRHEVVKHQVCGNDEDPGCGITRDYATGQMGEHSWAVTTPAVEATCTTAGKTAVETCSTCGTARGGEEVAALGHFYVDHVCKRCGEADHEHSWAVTTPAVEATCTTAGKTAVETCSVCGESEGGGEVAALGHDYVDGKCTRCGIDENHAHSWAVTTPAVEATCTEVGKTAVETCSVCGATQGGEEVAALGHEWGEWVRSFSGVVPCGAGDVTLTRYCANANCPVHKETKTEPGKHVICCYKGVYYCFNCDKTYKGDDIAHDPEWTYYDLVDKSFQNRYYYGDEPREEVVHS